MSGNSNILVPKHFHRLQRNQNQVQVHVPQQPSQPVPLNMVLYRKAVHGVLWVQLALVVSCLPYFIAATVLSKERPYPSEFIFILYCSIPSLLLLSLSTTFSTFGKLVKWSLSNSTDKITISCWLTLKNPSQKRSSERQAFLLVVINVEVGIIAQANFSRGAEKQTETFIQLRCVAKWADGIHKPIITLSTSTFFCPLLHFLAIPWS